MIERVMHELPTEVSVFSKGLGSPPWHLMRPD